MIPIDLFVIHKMQRFWDLLKTRPLEDWEALFTSGNKHVKSADVAAWRTLFTAEDINIRSAWTPVVDTERLINVVGVHLAGETGKAAYFSDHRTGGVSRVTTDSFIELWLLTPNKERTRALDHLTRIFMHGMSSYLTTLGVGQLTFIAAGDLMPDDKRFPRTAGSFQRMSSWLTSSEQGYPTPNWLVKGALPVVVALATETIGPNADPDASPYGVLTNAVPGGVEPKSSDDSTE